MKSFSLNLVCWGPVTVKYCAIQMTRTAGGCKSESLVVPTNMGAELSCCALVALIQMSKFRRKGFNIVYLNFPLQAARPILRIAQGGADVSFSEPMQRVVTMWAFMFHFSQIVHVHGHWCERLKECRQQKERKTTVIPYLI